MNNLQIKECSGYNRIEAFKDLKFNPTFFKGSNSTLAWKIAGSPIPGTEQFKEWAEEQLSKKTNKLLGYGLYIIISEYTPDYRLNPCKIVNNKTIGSSTWKITYWVREDELNIGEDGNINISKIGPLLDIFNTKKEAINFAKEYTKKTHKNCSLLRIKIPEDNLISGYSIYSPGAAAKKGTFVAFGYNKEE